MHSSLRILQHHFSLLCHTLTLGWDAAPPSPLRCIHRSDILGCRRATLIGKRDVQGGTINLAEFKQLLHDVLCRQSEKVDSGTFYATQWPLLRSIFLAFRTRKVTWFANLSVKGGAGPASEFSVRDLVGCIVCIHLSHLMINLRRGIHWWWF